MVSLGLSLYKTAHLEEALEVIEEVAELEPGEENHSSIMSDFQRAVSIDPELGAARENLAALEGRQQ